MAAPTMPIMTELAATMKAIEAVSCVRRVVGRIGTFHEPVPALSVFLDVTVRAEHPPSR